MKHSVEILHHKGKKILFSDSSGLGGSEFAHTIPQHYDKHLAMFKKGTDTYLILTDVSNAFAERETMRLLKESIKHNRPYIKKSAVVGGTGIQQVLHKSINVFPRVDTKLFDSKEDGLEWSAE